MIFKVFLPTLRSAKVRFSDLSCVFALLLGLTNSAVAADINSCAEPLASQNELKSVLPNPCLGEAGRLSQRDLEKELFPQLEKHIMTTHRNLIMWRYGYRTPDTRTDAKIEYDTSTPLLSSDALKHPSGTSADYQGPVDPKKNADQIFKRLTGGAKYSKGGGGKFGGGLYAAADPLSSLNYYNGSIISVEVPKGVKLISFTGDDDKQLEVSEPTLKALFCEEYRDEYGSPETWSAQTLAAMLTDLSRIDGQKNHFLAITELDRISVARSTLQNFYEKFGVAGVAANWVSAPYANCQSGSSESKDGRMIIFTDQEPKRKIKTRLMVEALELKPAHSKEKLYRSALDYFEAFDFDDCSKFSKETVPNLCSSVDPLYTKGIQQKFWTIYRPWAIHFYGLNPDVTQLELEAVQKQKSKAMDPARKRQLTADGFGCQKQDWILDSAQPNN